MIFDSGHISKNIEKVSPKKIALQPTDACPVAIEESVGNTAYDANNVNIEHKHHKKEFNEYPCTAPHRRIITPLSEVCLYVRRNTRGVQMVTSTKNLVKSRQILVARSIVEAVSA